MSRITKELAASIAEKLTVKSKESVEFLKNEYGKCVYDFYISQTPDEVKVGFSKYPDWFYTSKSISLNGFGFNWERISVQDHVVCNTGSSAYLTLNAKISDKITKHKRKYEKAAKEYRELFIETEQALLALRTYKNIEENIPAAKPYLPPPMSNALVCNFQSLNRKINNQPEIVKETADQLTK